MVNKKNEIIICFDMNGVLIDDEVIQYMAFREAIGNSSGKVLFRQEYQHYFSGKTDVEGLCAYLNLPDENACLALQAEKTRQYESLLQRCDESLKEKMVIKPVCDLVLRLKKGGYTTALVTGSTTYEVNLALAILQLAKDIFNYILCKEDYAHSKPAPDAYITACRLASVPPGKAIVIEDSPSGVAAAVAAGCYCLAIDTTHPPAVLQQADRVVSVEELGAVLDVVLA